MVLLSRQDHQAFSVLVHRHTSRFYACAYRACGDQDDAEDVVQECFLKIWRKPSLWKAGKRGKARKRGKAKKGAKFTTWFYRVVVNAAIDKVRARKRHEGEDKIAILADGCPAADEVMVRDERDLGIEAAVQGLPERQKIALNLCFYEELSNKEAAEIMGVGVKALESLLMRAKATLRDRLIRAKNEGDERYG